MKQLTLLIGALLCLTTTYSQTAKALSAREKDFETFWHTFNDHYAFFKLKGVNWDSTYLKYRPLVTKKTKEAKLLSLFEQMVTPLNDGHITISKGDEVVYKAKRPSYFKQEFNGLEKAFWQTVNTTLQNQQFTAPQGVGPTFREESLYYVAQNPQMGYIRITRCFGNMESLFDDAKEVKDTELMLSLFDSLLTTLSQKQALIIDVRTNGGGHGGIELASRLASSKRLTHYKAIRQKGDHEAFAPLDSQYITPHTGIQFLKPVVILTNDKTASSAEDFTISLYKQENVTIIGTNTSGMLSDMYGTDLSNHISFTLSNQRYYSIDHQLLEDKGVPVTIEIKNTKQDIQKGVDPVIVKAVERLNHDLGR